MRAASRQDAATHASSLKQLEDVAAADDVASELDHLPGSCSCSPADATFVPSGVIAGGGAAHVV